MSSHLLVEPARVEERAAALRLILQHLPTNEREARLAAALQLAERGELDPTGILVIRHQEKVAGAILCQSIAGAGGLLWPPQLMPSSWQSEGEDQLIRHAAHWLQQRGARLGQALLASSEAHLGQALERNGFVHITRLSYLRHALRHLPSEDHQLTFQPYDRCERQLFHQTLMRTYEDTLDCPEVNGVRTLDEVLAGHRAQGVFDPGRWWLVREREQTAGVLLLMDMPEWSAWEVAYIGVVPEARRRSVGRAMLLHALIEARAAGAPWVTLSVDDRNFPAMQLYRSLGFEVYDQREVYLAVWSRATPMKD